MFSAEAIFPSVGKLVFLWLHVDIHVHWAASNFMGENQLGASFPVFLVFRDIAFWYHRHSSHALKQKFGLYKRFVRKTNNSKHTFHLLYWDSHATGCILNSGFSVMFYETEIKAWTLLWLFLFRSAGFNDNIIQNGFDLISEDRRIGCEKGQNNFHATKCPEQGNEYCVGRSSFNKSKQTEYQQTTSMPPRVFMLVGVWNLFYKHLWLPHFWECYLLLRAQGTHIFYFFVN